MHVRSVFTHFIARLGLLIGQSSGKGFPVLSHILPCLQVRFHQKSAMVALVDDGTSLPNHTI